MSKQKCFSSSESVHTFDYIINTNLHGSRCNTAQLVADQDGGTIVPTYDWIGFLVPHFRKLIGIKKGHHFRVHSSQPGVVFMKQRADEATEVEHSLLKEGFDPGEFPEIIEPDGLSAQRQWYLHDKIREVKNTLTNTAMSILAAQLLQPIPVYS